MCATELAWAAGLFDGEGWISVNEKQKALEIGIGQKGRTVLERFKAAVGVGSVYEESSDFRTFHSYRVTGAKNQLRVLELIWPYLSEPKRDQARRAHLKLGEIREGLQRQVAEVADAYERMEGVMQG